MRMLALIFLFISLPARAKVCGLYQIEDFAERVFFSLSDFQSSPGRATIYDVVNSDSAIVKTMASGLCYCVDGPTQQDPQYGSDVTHQLLKVEKIIPPVDVDCEARSAATTHR